MNLRISELEEISSLANDDFLVLQRDTEDSKQSYKVKFSNFKRAFDSHLHEHGVKSAAQCAEDEFSKFAHAHDYSDFYYYPSYGPESKVDANKQNCKCFGKFNIMKYLPGYDIYESNEICCWQPPFTTADDDTAYEDEIRS